MTHWVLSVSLRMASKLGKNTVYQRANGLPVAGLSIAVAILVMVLSQQAEIWIRSDKVEDDAYRTVYENTWQQGASIGRARGGRVT